MSTINDWKIHSRTHLLHYHDYSIDRSAKQTSNKAIKQKKHNKKQQQQQQQKPTCNCCFLKITYKCYIWFETTLDNIGLFIYVFMYLVS